MERQLAIQLFDELSNTREALKRPEALFDGEHSKVVTLEVQGMPSGRDGLLTYTIDPDKSVF